MNLKADESNRQAVTERTRQAQTARHSAPFGLRRPHPTLAFGWLLAGLLVSGIAAGKESASVSAPETATAMPEESGALSALAVDPLAETGYVSPYDPVDQYLEAIDRIEMDYGPYAAELSDLYLGLGQTLLSSGEYERARDAFYRGVQGVRVNSGPNSPDQTNHLYLIANIEVVLGEFGTAEDVLENIYFVNSSHYGEDSAEMLPVLERMYQWHSMMRPAHSPDTNFRDFAKRVELTEEMVRVNEIVHGKGHPETSEAYRRLAEADFQAMLHLMNETIWLSPEEQVAVSSGIVYIQGGDASPFGDHYDQGRKAFRKYLESLAANDSTTALEYAEAFASLGDWCLVFEKPRQARNLYERAYKVLSQSDGYAHMAERYMAKPQPVYFMSPQPWLLEGLPEEQLRNLAIDISMTVNTLGVVRDVEILETPEGLTQDHLAAIQKWLRATSFRPALKEGEVVTSRDFIWQFIVTPDAIAPEGLALEGRAP